MNRAFQKAQKRRNISAWFMDSWCKMFTQYTIGQIVQMSTCLLKSGDVVDEDGVKPKGDQ